MLLKVISGGQTGADQGGLEAAKICGIPTGGTVPRGCKTEYGPMPELKTDYNVVEHKSDQYPPRTFDNAKMSDGTVRFAVNWTTRGEMLTREAIDRYHKPFFDVDPRKPRPVGEFVRWVIDNDIRTLNVAGNREGSWRGMHHAVVQYLQEAFKLLKGLANIPKASPFKEFFDDLRASHEKHRWRIDDDGIIRSQSDHRTLLDVLVVPNAENTAAKSILQACSGDIRSNTARYIRKTMEKVIANIEVDLLE